MFSSCNPKFFAVRHIHYPVNTSSDHFHTDAILPSSDHCRTERGDFFKFKVEQNGKYNTSEFAITSTSHTICTTKYTIFTTHI